MRPGPQRRDRAARAPAQRRQPRQRRRPHARREASRRASWTRSSTTPVQRATSATSAASRCSATTRPRGTRSVVPEGHTIHRLARTTRPLLVGEQVSLGQPAGPVRRWRRAADRPRCSTASSRTASTSSTRSRATSAARPPRAVREVDRRRRAAARRGRAALRMTAGTPGSTCAARRPARSTTRTDRNAVLARLGPDPLRRTPTATSPGPALSRSRPPIGQLLMDQSVLAGVGNVYRAEVLFRAAAVPVHRRQRGVPRRRWDALWEDLRVLMRAGVRANRIVTTAREDRDRRPVRRPREDAHYVYRRAGRPAACAAPRSAPQVMAGAQPVLVPDRPGLAPRTPSGSGPRGPASPKATVRPRPGAARPPSRRRRGCQRGAAQVGGAELADVQHQVGGVAGRGADRAGRSRRTAASGRRSTGSAASVTSSTTSTSTA